MEPQESNGNDVKEVEKKELIEIGRVITESEPATAFEKLTPSQVALIKRTIAKGASNDELSMFIQVCSSAKLNPFLRQAHLVPRWDSKTGGEIRTIQVGIDGLRSIADRTGSYAGSSDYNFTGEKVIEITKDKNKTEVKVPNEATVTVKKVVQGTIAEFTATARWDEYYPGAKQGYKWHTMPYLMLGKCAEALALRKGFPLQMSGLYAQEEMDRINTEGGTENRQQKAFQTAKDSIGKVSDKKKLEEFRKKLESTDKYTTEQIEELTSLIDERLQQL